MTVWQLSYLTSLPAKANVLIDQTGRARLADFGLLTIISDPANHLSSGSFTAGGTVRWMSPELIAPERFGFTNGRPTKQSDCYALGMVIYETISGNLPFHKDPNPAVYLKVVEGKRPLRRMVFTEPLWEMLELCWMSQPSDRPAIEGVLQCLEAAQNLPVPPFVEMEEDGDDWGSTTSSPGIPNWLGGTATIERNTVTSPGLGCPSDHLPINPIWSTPEPPTRATHQVKIHVGRSAHSPTQSHPSSFTSDVMWVVNQLSYECSRLTKSRAGVHRNMSLSTETRLNSVRPWFRAHLSPYCPPLSRGSLQNHGYRSRFLEGAGYNIRKWGKPL